jgi:hypothetical protein
VSLHLYSDMSLMVLQYRNGHFRKDLFSLEKKERRRKFYSLYFSMPFPLGCCVVASVRT